MARKPSVRYWSSRNAYCCWVAGVQHILARGLDDAPRGPTYLAAVAAFHRILSLAEPGDDPTVRVVCEHYLEHISTRRKQGTVTLRHRALKDFVAESGDTPLSRLTHLLVYRYIDGRRKTPRHVNRIRGSSTWGDTSVRIFLDSLAAAFNWAVRVGLAAQNPLHGIERPAPRKRTDVLEPAQHAAILAACSKWLRPVVVVLEGTGARPGEIIAATASDLDTALHAIVYKGDDRRREDEFAHKSSAKKDRVIYHSGDALAETQRAAAARPRGPLFVRKSGKPYTLNALVSAFWRLRVRCSLPRLTPYSYRHTFATRWLEQGRSVDLLAELLGNTPETIRRHYSHLCGRHAGLRQHLEEFRTT